MTPSLLLVSELTVALLTVAAPAFAQSPAMPSSTMPSGSTLPNAASPAIAAPDVEQRAHVVTAPHGAQRQDEYYWLRDDSRQDLAMLAYLNAENAYVDAVMAPLKAVEDTMYVEIVWRIKQDASSVPYRERGWWYYTRYETGQDYPV